jgi:hypothetical protein
LPDDVRLALAFGLALGAALITVPAAIRLAWRTDFLDRPVGFKKHGRPTPYLGAVLVLDWSYEGDVAAALPTPVQQELRS